MYNLEKKLYSNFLLLPFQITTLEPMIAGLQEALPKSIGLLPFDGGVAGKWF